MSSRPFYTHNVDDREPFHDNASFIDSIGTETVVVVGLIAVVVTLLVIMALLHCWLKCVSSKEERKRRLSIRSTDMRYLTQIRTLQRRQAEVEKARNGSAGTKLTLEVVDEDFLIPSPSSRNSSPARPRSRTPVPAQTAEKLKNLKDELEHFKINHGVNVRPALPLSEAGIGLGPRRRTWEGLPDDFGDISYDEVPDSDPHDTFSSPEFDFNQNDLPPPPPRHASSSSPMSGRSSPPRREAFTPIPMPNVCDVSIQTTGSLERKFPPGKKVFATSFETTV
uniref:Neural proliferation differentiation and control protein 1 n=1 Tax=Panagrellus redivivus TaxID=6233 RepID=A0A7E4VV06_PANRE